MALRTSRDSFRKQWKVSSFIFQGSYGVIEAEMRIFGDGEEKCTRGERGSGACCACV